MKDREIFRRALSNLPKLLPGFFVMHGAFFLEEAGIRAIATMANSRGRFQEIVTNPLITAIVFLVSFMIAVMITVFKTVFSLGAHRSCLQAGEGKPIQQSWTIFQKGQWKQYISWAIWCYVIRFAFNLGWRGVMFLLANHMNDTEYYSLLSQVNQWSFLWSFALSLLLIGLLQCSVRTAYIRRPENGFWKAVIYGLKEGLRKWPKTIGPQLKFVIPVLFAFRMISGYVVVPLFHMLQQSNILGMSPAVFVTQGLEVADGIWNSVFYGCLAAARYDPPEGEICRVEDEELQ